MRLQKSQEVIGLNMVEFWLSSEGQALLSSWARDGLSIGEIAGKIGITCRTLLKWIEKYPSIKEKIYSSRQVIDAKVEEAILKKALGFEATEVRHVTKANGDEEITAVTKLVPPDISACSMWLKNSCPEKWSDQRENDDSKVDEILSRLDEDAERGDY